MYKVIQELKMCDKCKKKTVHNCNVPKWNWVMHIILVLLTGFFWLIPWALYALYVNSTHKEEWICSECK